MPYNLYDFEVIIEPIIFQLEIDVEHTSTKQEKQDPACFRNDVLHILSQYQYIILDDDKHCITFSFINCASETAVTQARDIQQKTQSYYTHEAHVSIGFSTLGLKEHKYMHQDMLKYRGTEEFNMMMSGYIRYLDISEYENWLKG